jgi:hypothetical protein
MTTATAAAAAKKTAPKRPAVTSKDAWEALGIHTITLPSGAVVDIRIPDLSLLLAGDAVPEQLRGAALQEIVTAFSSAKGDEEARAAEAMGKLATDPEGLNQLVDLYRWLVTVTLVDPVITEEELRTRKFPSEDLTMITEFAGRRRLMDARGVTLGIEPIDRWDLWRQAHVCDEECPACEAVINGLSTTFTG